MSLLVDTEFQQYSCTNQASTRAGGGEAFPKEEKHPPQPLQPSRTLTKITKASYFLQRTSFQPPAWISKVSPIPDFVILPIQLTSCPRKGDRCAQKSNFCLPLLLPHPTTEALLMVPGGYNTAYFPSPPSWPLAIRALKSLLSVIAKVELKTCCRNCDLDERVGKRKSDSSQHLRLEKGVEGRCQG
jgi:hypothetical protein